MKYIMSCFTIALALQAVSEAQAGSRVDRRQNRQGARIHQGVQSGELNRREAGRLVAGQKHVNRLENRAEADGEVSNKEKIRLEKAQDRQSRRIFEQKHDGQEQAE